LNPWGFLLLKLILSETREKKREGKERAEDANKQSGLGLASDQILGDNNIGDGPFNLLFHARPAAV
jgi:hypothetical protein